MGYYFTWQYIISAMMLISLVAHGLRLPSRRAFTSTKAFLSTNNEAIIPNEPLNQEDVDISRSRFGLLGLNESLMKGLAKQSEQSSTSYCTLFLC